MASEYLIVMAAAAAATPPVPASDDGTIARLIEATSIRVSNHDNNEGNVTLQLEIDPGGHITGCRDYSASFGGMKRADEILDRLCPALQREIRFRPARQADGTPSNGRYWVGVGFDLKETGLRAKMLPLRYQVLDQDPHEYPHADGELTNSAPEPARAFEMVSGAVTMRTDLEAVQGIRVLSRADPAIERPLRPVGDPDRWLDEWRVPRQPIPVGEYTIAVRLGTGPDGVPYGCEILKSFGIAALDQLACEMLLQRARFYPAHSDTHYGMGGTWEGQYRWRVPAELPPDPQITPPPPPAPPVAVATLPRPIAQKPTQKLPPRAARPLAGIENWVSNADYPRSLHNGERGVTRFKLTIGPDGRPTACSILKTSGTPLLDERTCMVIMRRARFAPATDEHGDAITGYYEGSLRWAPPVTSPTAS